MCLYGNVAWHGSLDVIMDVDSSSMACTTLIGPRAYQCKLDSGSCNCPNKSQLYGFGIVNIASDCISGVYLTVPRTLIHSMLLEHTLLT